VATVFAEMRLAYVARLLRSLAMAYGMSTDYGGERAVFVEEHDDYAPVAVLGALSRLSKPLRL
jgi:hypothetical protein